MEREKWIGQNAAVMSVYTEDEEVIKQASKVLHNNIEYEDFINLVLTVKYITEKQDDDVLKSSLKVLDKNPEARECLIEFVKYKFSSDDIDKLSDLFDQYEDIKPYAKAIKLLVTMDDKIQAMNAISIFSDYAQKEGIEDIAEAIEKFVKVEPKPVQNLMKCFCSYNSIEVLLSYESRKDVIKAVTRHALRKIEAVRLTGSVNNVLGLLEVKEIIEGGNSEEKAFCIMEVYMNQYYSVIDKQNLAVNTARALKNYNSTAADILTYMSVNKSGEMTNKVALILEKYSNQIDKIYDGMFKGEEDLQEKTLDELLSDRAYEAISKDSSVLSKIFKMNCDYLRNKIEFDFDYPELEKVKKAFDFVKDIHRDRNGEDLHKIEDGFYEQLNRAVRQEEDIKGKVRMLNEYCRDVIHQMGENADDLMIILRP